MTIHIHMTEDQFTLNWCHAALAKKGLDEATTVATVARHGAWLQSLLAGLDDAVVETGGIPLDLNPGQAQQLRTRGGLADQAFTKAINADDIDGMRRAANHLWDVLEEAYISSPQDEDGKNTLAPDGSETNKP